MSEKSEERAAVVAYLRAEERLARIRRPRVDSETIAYANALSNAALAIENGEHIIATHPNQGEQSR